MRLRTLKAEGTMQAKARSSIVCVQGTGTSWGVERKDAREEGGRPGCGQPAIQS